MSKPDIVTQLANYQSFLRTSSPGMLSAYKTLRGQASLSVSERLKVHTELQKPVDRETAKLREIEQNRRIELFNREQCAQMGIEYDPVMFGAPVDTDESSFEDDESICGQDYDFDDDSEYSDDEYDDEAEDDVLSTVQIDDSITTPRFTSNVRFIGQLSPPDEDEESLTTRSGLRSTFDGPVYLPDTDDEESDNYVFSYEKLSMDLTAKREQFLVMFSVDEPVLTQFVDVPVGLKSVDSIDYADFSQVPVRSYQDEEFLTCGKDPNLYLKRNGIRSTLFHSPYSIPLGRFVHLTFLEKGSALKDHPNILLVCLDENGRKFYTRGVVKEDFPDENVVVFTLHLTFPDRATLVDVFLHQVKSGTADVFT